MMIIGTGLYRPSIGFLFITKMITPWSLTMTITNVTWLTITHQNDHFFTIMHQNDGSFGSFFFMSFFGDGGGNNRSMSSDDVCDFSFLLQSSWHLTLSLLRMPSMLGKQERMGFLRNVLFLEKIKRSFPPRPQHKDWRLGPTLCCGGVWMWCSTSKTRKCSTSSFTHGWPPCCLLPLALPSCFFIGPHTLLLY